jgi:tetratricopeptide (TPR) repeat protein
VTTVRETRGALGYHRRAVAAAREGRLHSAARLAERALASRPDADLRARIVVHQAYLVAETRSGDEALRMLDGLEADGGLSQELRGLAAVNRGLVLSRVSSSRAVRAFDEALHLLPETDLEPRAAALINRGCLLLGVEDLGAAASDFREALRVADAGGVAVLSAMAAANLAYTLMLAGDLPAALRAMEVAEPSLARLSPVMAAKGQVNRAEVLLAAGLLDEAAVRLRDAARTLGRHRAAYEQAEAEQQLARVLVALDRPEQALAVAASAARRFQRIDAAVQALQCERLALYARVRRGRGLAGVAPRADEVAEQFEARGLPLEARRTRLVAAEALIARGDVRGARRSVQRWGALRRDDSTLDRLRGRQVRAALADAEGRGAQADRDLRRGVAELQTHATTLGSLELRAAVAVHAQEIASQGVRRAVRDGSANRVLAWAELTRGLSQRLPRVTPEPDPEVAAWSQELRLLRARLREPDGAGAPLQVRAGELEQLLRSRAWQTGVPGARAAPEGDGPPGATRSPVAAPAQVRAALAEADGTLLALLAVDGRLLAVRVDGRRSTLHPLGPVTPVLDLARRVRADLDLLASAWTPAVIRQVAERSAWEGLARLDDLLVRAVPGGQGDGPVLLAPAGVLSLVPWGSLPSLRGRPVTVSPTATSWLGARPAGVRLSRLGAVSGPGLVHGDDEVRTVARSWPGSSVVVGATAAQALEVAAGSEVFHVAAHGVHEPQNPLFSHLLMSDGPLFGHELHGLARPPRHVVLSACELGCAEPRPGDERLGMTAALLAAGVGSVVAGVARVDDRVSAEVAAAHHRGLAAGLPPARALAAAVAGLPADAPPAPFVCFGSGW